MTRTSQRGFSLVEITVVLAVVAGLLLIVYSMIDETLRATMFNESHNDLTILTQRAVNALQLEVAQSRQVFQEDADGAAYRAALQIPAGYARWSNTLLPILQADPTMSPDSANGASRYTGNSMLLVRQLPPLSIMYDDDNNFRTPNVEILVDHYRFEYFFLSPDASRRFSASSFTLNLLQSTSVEYADFFQLNNLTRTQLQQLGPQIIATGITQAWDPGQPLASAFYTIPPNGNFGPALRAPTIPIATTVSLFPELRGGRISGKMDYSVAFVPASPAPAYPLRMPIAVYAAADSTIPQFPSGFEVKITGPSGSRKVMTRTLLMARYGTTTYETQQGFVTTAARF